MKELNKALMWIIEFAMYGLLVFVIFDLLAETVDLQTVISMLIIIFWKMTLTPRTIVHVRMTGGDKHEYKFKYHRGRNHSTGGRKNKFAKTASTGSY